jgi:hypothetical protein
MPSRRETVIIPALLDRDERVLAFAQISGFSRMHAYAVVVMVLTELAFSAGDTSRIPFAELMGAVNVELFKKLFLDKDRCPLYDEYNGARDRHRERCRGQAAKYRPKKKAPTFGRHNIFSVGSEPIGAFDGAWAKYPKRSGGNPRATALKAWRARVREGVSEEELTLATSNYAAHCELEKKVGTPYVMQGSTFYGTGQRWRDFLVAPVDPEMDEIMAEIRHNFQEE